MHNDSILITHTSEWSRLVGFMKCQISLAKGYKYKALLQKKPRNWRMYLVAVTSSRLHEMSDLSEVWPPRYDLFGKRAL